MGGLQYTNRLGHGNEEAVREKYDPSFEDEREYTMQVLSKENNKYSLRNRDEGIQNSTFKG